MALTDVHLMSILRIAQDLSRPASDLSLRTALERTAYREHRPHFTSAEVRALLEAHPALIESWLAYAEGKRTSEGWYVLRDGEVGEVLRPASQRSYRTIEEAVAAFIVHELDRAAGLAG